MPRNVFLVINISGHNRWKEFRRIFACIFLLPIVWNAPDLSLRWNVWGVSYDHRTCQLYPRFRRIQMISIWNLVRFYSNVSWKIRHLLHPNLSFPLIYFISQIKTFELVSVGAQTRKWSYSWTIDLRLINEIISFGINIKVVAAKNRKDSITRSDLHLLLNLRVLLLYIWNPLNL